MQLQKNAAILLKVDLESNFGKFTLVYFINDMTLYIHHKSDTYDDFPPNPNKATIAHAYDFRQKIFYRHRNGKNTPIISIAFGRFPLENL